jgi:hypothetical protein
MPDKALISSLTWRSLEMQKAAFPDMPHFIAPEDLHSLFRATTRQAIDRIHVLSLGVIADNDRALKDFIALAKQRPCVLVSTEEGAEFGFTKKADVGRLTDSWRVARKHGVAKVGGRVSAAKREDESKKAIEVIRERWPLPNSVWTTPTLLKEAGAAMGKKKPMSYNTAKKYLGSRVIAQFNYQAKLKRKANAKPKD